MDKFERIIFILILLLIGFLQYCITEYSQSSFITKAILASISNAAALLSLYLFLKDKE
jgi:hypothetical protein